jgi:hypothetical protein
MSAYAGQLTAQDSPQEIKEKIERSRPIKPLPTDRISPPNQLKILRAWASVSKNGTRAATVNEVARLVEMAASTVAMANPFFSSIGLLQRLAVGTYAPSGDVIAFLTAPNPDTAPRKLASAFRQAWFGQVLIPRLTYAPINEEAALSLLEDVADTGVEHRKAIGFVLDLMEASELIERSEGQIKLLPAAQEPSDNTAQRPPTVFLDHSTGNAHFRVSVNVDSKDLANWSADAITAFFKGLSDLIAAKGEK